MYAAAIFVLSSLPAVIKSPQLTHLDKIAHALEFGIFSILLYRAMFVSFTTIPISTLILMTVLASISYGALDEYHQFFSPMRTPDLSDLLADVIGILIAQGIILVRVYRRL